MSINVLDVFNSDTFGLVALTNAINDFTPVYTYLNALGLFLDEGVTQRTVMVDFDPETNALLPKSEWGGPGVANKTAVGRSRSYPVPHFPVSDYILAADLQGRRRPGSDQVVDAQWVTGKKMREMRKKLEQTKEWMRLGVLKSGQVKDGSGNLILDIYADFGISQQSTGFALSTGTTDVMGKIAGVKRQSLQALRGELCSQFVAMCSDTFFDALVSHPNVQKAYQYYQNNNGQNLATDYSGGQARPDSQAVFSRVAGFLFGGVTWINYTGSLTDANGSSQTMIDTDSAYLFPLGTEVFKTFYAPADYLETVNTEGMQFYAKQEVMRFQKGIELECQSNPLPICLKPLVIQKMTKV